MRSTDARSRERDRPEGVTQGFQVILNKVDSNRMKLYQAYGSSDYYSSRYTSYYRT